MTSSKTRSERIVVLGNGPSLRGFDFHNLAAVDTLGMNAAYRHWERIGWYPTHYCCLDDQLIETHADAIHDMVVGGKVQSAFLITRILDFHPDLAGRQDVFFLESFNRTRHARVGNPRVPFIVSLPFRESDASKVTTGAYAVRYAAHLGYREIAILGVDLRYVEQIPEAAASEGIKLVMERTPEHNPNYFFDDYQRAGDKFNVPNPAAHDHNLHVASFESLVRDIVTFAWPARVCNANPESVLQQKHILPLVDIASFARSRALGAVVVPTTAREERQLLANLELWGMPRFAPFAGMPPDQRPDLVIAFSGHEDAALRVRVETAFAASPELARAFERLDVVFVGLDESLDYYERDYTREVRGRGHKSGPNEQFFELLPRLRDRGEFIFYMETDCAPLRHGWLDRLHHMASSDHESWIIGSVYRGGDTISDRFVLHLNGNALYRVGASEFQDFAATYWRPMLYKLIAAEDRRMAYDCVLSFVFTAAVPEQSNDAWRRLQALNHRFRATEVIQNLSGAADLRAAVEPEVRRLLAEHPTTDIVHGRQFVGWLHGTLDRWRRMSSPGKGDFSWEMALSLANGEPVAAAVAPATTSAFAFPRLLVIDSTPVGGGSATGQLKSVLLQDWPAAAWLQVCQSKGGLALHRASGTMAAGDIAKECRAFRPDLVYFRPVDSAALVQFADDFLQDSSVPLIVHVMDDWPERLRVQDPSLHARIDPVFRKLLRRASHRLVIGEAMAVAYRARYGLDFEPLANGVDIDAFARPVASPRAPLSDTQPFVVRYMGGLAADMNAAGVADIARVVSELSAELPIRLEIHTMAWYREQALASMGSFAAVSIGPLVPQEQYVSALLDADCLLIAYNFDPDSHRYVGLSMANKLPECLAAGVPVLAYGPSSMATIAYLMESQCAECVTERDPAQIKAALRRLVAHPDHARRLGSAGREHAARHFRRDAVIRRFRQIVEAATRDSRKSSGSGAVVGGRPRGEHDHAPGRIIVDAGMQSVGPSRWRATPTPSQPARWLHTFVCRSVRGRSFIGAVRLRVSRPAKIALSLGRHGSKAYEGSGRSFEVTAGEWVLLQVEHRFADEHAQVQIQVVLPPAPAGAGGVDLEIASTTLQALPAAPASPGHVSVDRSFAAANQLFRAGEWRSALDTYVQLHDRCPLGVYAANALAAARRLGIEAATVDELRAHLAQQGGTAGHDPFMGSQQASSSA